MIVIPVHNLANINRASSSRYSRNASKPMVTTKKMSELSLLI